MMLVPQAYQKFVIWDASKSSDDNSSLNKLLLGLTPDVSLWNVKQSIELNSGNPIIDVRTKEEYGDKHIPGAILIPETTLFETIPKMYPDKNIIIYLYDQEGFSGAVSTRLLRSLGYDRAFNMKDGLNGWEKAKYPTQGSALIFF